jgi:hypothetical protein
MNPGVVAVIGLCALLAAWYGVGYWYNRRLSGRIRRWLELAGTILGSERETGWLGTPASGAWMRVDHAQRPFRRMEIAALVENRELLPTWLFAHLRGKRDCLIIKATLHAPSRDEVEVAPAGGAVAGQLRKAQEEPWNWEEGPRGLAVAYRGPNARRQADALNPWIQKYGNCLERFSWRRQEPQIQLQMKAADLLAQPGETFFSDLQQAVDPAGRAGDRRAIRTAEHNSRGGGE